MKRETYKLKQLCSEIVDCVNKTAPTSDVPTPYKMLRTSDIREGKINLENLNCVTKEVYEKWTRRGKLQKGDVIFTREAPLGEVGLVREEKNYFLGQRLVLFRANDKICDGRFLMYSLLWHDNKQAIISKGVGSTVAHLRVPECENIEIKAPDLDIQHRIADILSAYDDLIENNQKQIKLLEEAVQRLYKEWFVDLRFPGYENMKIVDGVPEGWSKTNINEILTFHRGYDLTKNEMKAGRYPVVGSTTVIGYHNEFKINGPGIVTGRSGSLGKYQFIWDNFWPHNTSLYISDYKDHNIFFVYSLLQTVDFASLNNGGAIPTLNRNVLSNIEVIEPTDELQEMFAKIAEPQYQKIKNLEKQNDRLKIARDLLLAKLMSGEMEV